MNAYLTKIGIRREIQEWLEPYYRTDVNGNLCFSYDSDTEVYGLAFHRIPSTSGSWIAGPENLALVREAVICSSAMEAISWLNFNLAAFRMLDNVLFVATGTNLAESKLSALRSSLHPRKYNLVFGNDLLGRICDLKAAAMLAGFPLEIAVSGDMVQITFRYEQFQMPCEIFSINGFERLCRYRFSVKTFKPVRHVSWLAWLQEKSFNP